MTVPTDVAIYLLNHKRAELAAMEAEFETEIVIVGDDSLMNIDQYSIQRVAPEQNKTEELLAAYEPSTDAKKKNAQRRLFLYIFLQALPTADGFVKRTLFALGISCRTEVAAKEDEQMVAFVPAAAVDLAAQLPFHL